MTQLQVEGLLSFGQILCCNQVLPRPLAFHYSQLSPLKVAVTVWIQYPKGETQVAERSGRRRNPFGPSTPAVLTDSPPATYFSGFSNLGVSRSLKWSLLFCRSFVSKLVRVARFGHFRVG